MKLLLVSVTTLLLGIFSASEVAADTGCADDNTCDPGGQLHLYPLCEMNICALNGGCTTISMNKTVSPAPNVTDWDYLPDGNPPYVNNLRYYRAAKGIVQLASCIRSGHLPTRTYPSKFGDSYQRDFASRIGATNGGCTTACTNNTDGEDLQPAYYENLCYFNITLGTVQLAACDGKGDELQCVVTPWYTPGEGFGVPYSDHNLTIGPGGHPVQMWGCAV
ncbi:hypothetical protein QBC44DRAFT_305868 [Cladorrhinum sp. PSN332]|nr:hypothetical protein QBC44DRAFT_305868 [Cladorrhinum sp. PSN332]